MRLYLAGQQLVRVELQRTVHEPDLAMSSLATPQFSQRARVPIPRPAYEGSVRVIEESLATGQIEAALAHTVELAAAVRRSEERDALLYAAGTELLLGRCLAALCRPASASRHLRRALEYAGSLGDSPQSSRIRLAADEQLRSL